MEIRQSKSGILVWLTREEQEDGAVKTHIDELKKSSRVAVFYSGDKSNEEQVKKLVLNNME